MYLSTAACYNNYYSNHKAYYCVGMYSFDGIAFKIKKSVKGRLFIKIDFWYHFCDMMFSLS